MTKVTIEVEEEIAALASALRVIEVGTHIEAFPGDRIVVYAGRTAIDVDTSARIPRPLAIAGPPAEAKAKTAPTKQQPPAARKTKRADVRSEVETAILQALATSPLTVQQIEEAIGRRSLNYRLQAMVRCKLLKVAPRKHASAPYVYSVNPKPPHRRADPLQRSDKTALAKADEQVLHILRGARKPLLMREIISSTRLPRNRVHWALRRLRLKEAIHMQTADGAPTHERYSYTTTPPSHLRMSD